MCAVAFSQFFALLLAGPYAVTQFLPLTIITCCAVASLWIDITVAPARAGVAITSILSLVALTFAFTKDLPETPSLTYTSIYNIICLLVALTCLLVFVLVHAVRNWETAKPKPPPPPPAKPETYSQQTSPQFQPPHTTIDVKPADGIVSLIGAKAKEPKQVWLQIKTICRIAWPVGYGIIILVFFAVVGTNP